MWNSEEKYVDRNLEALPRVYFESTNVAERTSSSSLLFVLLIVKAS
jgi:hypothetical protein